MTTKQMRIASSVVDTIPMTARRLKVRPATMDDFDAMLTMKSDPGDVMWSGFASPPNPENYREWWATNLGNPTRMMFIGYIGSDPAGYVHFARSNGTNQFGITYGVAHAYRGRGVGTALLKSSIADVRKSCAVNPQFQAWIAVSNNGSEKACLKAGFCLSEHVRDQEYLYPERRVERMRLWII